MKIGKNSSEYFLEKIRLKGKISYGISDSPWRI